MTTILMVDDHELIRSGLAGAFEASGQFEVVGQAGSVAEALAVARQTTPDVVVTDVRLPDGTGLDIVRTLRGERPDLGLVVLTMYAGDEQLFAAMDAGASAFVGKQADVGQAAALGTRERGPRPTRGRPRRQRDREQALRERVDHEVAHHQDLREARRRQPGPGPGLRDAPGPAAKRQRSRVKITSRVKVFRRLRIS